MGAIGEENVDSKRTSLARPQIQEEKMKLSKLKPRNHIIIEGSKEKHRPQ